jgi:hypothetical protein
MRCCRHIDKMSDDYRLYSVVKALVARKNSCLDEHAQAHPAPPG